MNRPENLIIHHSAVSREKNSEQFDAINSYHKGKGWGMIGYHFLIEPNGEVKKGRNEDQSGAHTYQESMNYLSLGICLSGNFDVESPTQAQLDSLTSLIEEKQKQYGIPKSKVKLHRYYATYKSCAGRNIPDNIFEMFDDTIQKQIKDNEAILAQRMDEAWHAVNEATATLKYLCDLKNIPRKEYAIVERPCDPSLTD